MSEIERVARAVFGDVEIRTGYSSEHRTAYVVAVDLRNALEYRSSTHRFVDSLTEAQAKGGTGDTPLYTGRERVQTAGGPQMMAVIYKRGVFHLLMRSELPSATEYRDRLFDLLEAVERDGGYVSPDATALQRVRLFEQITYLDVRDLLAQASDYDSGSDLARRFFADMQNRFHVAVTGMTAAQITASRPRSDGAVYTRGPRKGQLKHHDTAKDAMTDRELRAESYLGRIASGRLGLFVLDRTEFTMAEFVNQVSAVLDEHVTRRNR